MSNFDVQYPPSPQWQTTQNYLDAPNHSIQKSGLESYQTVIKTESYVKQIWEVNKKNDLETTQQVSPTIQMQRNKQYLKSNHMIQQEQIQVKESEITRSSSQQNFARAGPRKTFISSNAIIGSTTGSGNGSLTKLSSQSCYHVANSSDAFISSHKHLSQRIEELYKHPAMLPPKSLSHTNVKYGALTSSTQLNGKALKPFTEDESDYKSSTRGNLKKSLLSRSKCAQTVTSDGLPKSNESTYWPMESYSESSYVPGIPNNKFMFHSQLQNENNDKKTPEQYTCVTKNSIRSPPQALSETFKSVDVEQSTDNETSKSSLDEDSGKKNSPSLAQAGSAQKKLTSAESGETTSKQEHQLQRLPLQFDQSSHNKYLMSNGSFQPTKPTKLDPPILCYPETARKYMSKKQSPVNIPVTVAVEHCYSKMTQSDGTKSKHPETQAMDKPQYQSNSALLVSNEVVIESKTPRVDSIYAGALPKNDLTQAANKETLKSNDLTREQSTVGEESILKHSPSRAADNKNTLTTFNDLIPEEIKPGQEYQLQLLPIQFSDTQSSLSKEHTAWNELLLQTSTSELNSLTNLSQPLTAQSFNLDEKSNESILLTVGNDIFLDYPEMQVVEYEVTLPADQPHYQTVPSDENESSTVGIDPVKNYTTTNANNKVIIESNVLINPPKKSVVKSTYAGALPKNPRKNSNQMIHDPTISKAGPMIGSNRLSLQSKLPRIGGANVRTTQSNVDMKSNGSIQQTTSAVKPPMKLQEHKPHPLPKKTVDTKSTPLKRKLKENTLPIVPSKKPSLQNPKEPQIIVGDKSFRLSNVSIERVQIVGGIEKRQTLRELTLDAPSKPNAKVMTFSDCMDTLLRNNIHIFKVPMKPKNVLDKYMKTLEKNNVRVTKIKK